MKPSLFLLIASDPRSSHRPAEAIRIAAGLQASQQLELNLYLHDCAILMLAEQIADLIDEEHLHRYLPLLARPESPTCTLAANPYLPGLGPTRVPCRLLAPDALRNLAASCHYLLRY